MTFFFFHLIFAKKFIVMKEERWLPVVGYEGLYEVSSLGRVKSLNYNHTGKEKILSPGKTSRWYLHVDLCKNGKSYQRLIHRLVAIAFIPNPENKPEVHHRDGNTHNNIVSNLLLVSRKEHRAIDCSKKVICVETGKVYESASEAARQIGAHVSGISKCCCGIYKTFKGYHWKYFIE